MGLEKLNLSGPITVSQNNDTPAAALILEESSIILEPDKVLSKPHTDPAPINIPPNTLYSSGMPIGKDVSKLTAAKKTHPH